MTLIVSSLLFFVIASGSFREVSPYFLNDIYLGAEPPACVDEQMRLSPEHSANSLEQVGRGRLATFTLRGQTICEHQIFDSDDRDRFVDFVVTQAPLRAKSVAQVLQRSVNQSNTAAPRLTLPLMINLTGSELVAADAVRSAFTNEITAVLGPGAVARLQTSDVKSRLNIEVQRVDALDLLFRVELESAGKDGTQNKVSL